MKDLFYRLLLILRNRVFLLFVAFVVGFAALWGALYYTQIISYEHYTELQAENLYSQQAMTAERGNIYDRYGRPLAVNVETKALFYLPSTTNPHLVQSIMDVLDILDRNGEEVTLQTEFPLGYEDGRGYYFVDNYTRTYNSVAHDNFLAEVYGTSRDELTDEQKDTDATTSMKILCNERFGIPLDEVTPEQAIRIASVRYAIFSGRFDPSVKVPISNDISIRTEAQILERNGEYGGFSVEKIFTRVYPEGELFAHIVGYVGRINEEELASKQAAGLDYTEQDYIGKTGLEAVFEQSLRGTSGSMRMEVDAATGLVLNSVTLQAAEKGNNIFLTIDRDLQQETYEALENHIKALLIDKITGEHGKQGATYSAIDVYTALIANHFLTSSMLDYKADPSTYYYDPSGNNDYLYAFRTCCHNAMTSSIDELYDLIYNTRISVEFFEPWQKDLYDLLIGNMRDEVHLSYGYQDDEDFYPSYADGKIAPYDFLYYCFENSYIDESLYGITRQDSIDTKIYKLLTFELPLIQDLPEFETYIYSYILSTGRYPTKSFLFLLYEQGLISNEDGTRDMLEWDEISEIDVLHIKIQNDEIKPSDINLDPCSGSVTVTDPKTGEVLAIVSYPTYDPNRFLSDASYYNKVVLDNSGPLSFRAVEELRAIGSTFKLCTAIAGLDTGTITENTLIYDDVTFPYANTESDPSCWSSFSHGDINVIQALDYSCNYFFYQIGFLLSEPVPATADDPPFGPLSTRDSQYRFDDSVGLAKLKTYTDLLGLSTKTNIELAESFPQASTLDAVRSAIGQGNGSYSCANLNRYTCTIANGGTVYDLFLVDEIQTSSGATIYKGGGTYDHKTNLSEKIISIVKQGMRLVVIDDHGPDFEELESYGIRCAGKTGTAQEDETRPDHSLFTGYTNLEDPELAISVMIPFGGGSKNAIPVFVDITANYYGVSLDRNTVE